MTKVSARVKGLHPRTLSALINSFWGVIIKGGSLGISLLMVPLTLKCLDNTTFGVWTTLSSLLTLLAFFDIGLGNGLRNRLTEALSNNDPLLARSYVSTAYLLFAGTQLILLLLFVVVNNFIPWARLLNTTIPRHLLGQLSLILFIGVSAKLVFDLITFVFYARQEPAKAGLMLLVINITTLTGLLYLVYTGQGNLINLAILNAVCPLVVLLITSFWLYNGSLSFLKPVPRFFRRVHIRGLLGLGSKFFIIQLAVVIIFYSDNLIITQLFGPEYVTPYNISYRYFNIINTFFAIMLTPFWSAFTEAHVKGEYDWMRASYKRLWWLWLGIVGLVLVWIILAPTIYALWVGKRVQIPFLLTLCMGLSIIVMCLNNITVVVINGLGKIKLQLFSALFSAAINLPLSILFGQYLGLGSAGVILATTLSLLSGSVIGFLQARRLLNRTAAGIWNQ